MVSGDRGERITKLHCQSHFDLCSNRVCLITHGIVCPLCISKNGQGLEITFGSLKYLYGDIIRNGLVNLQETTQLCPFLGEQGRAVNKCYLILSVLHSGHEQGQDNHDLQVLLNDHNLGVPALHIILMSETSEVQLCCNAL